MATETVIGRTEQALSTLSTTMRYAWYTGWLPAMGVDTIKSVLQARNLTGNVEAKLAYQVAPVREEAPSAWSTTWDAWHSGDGEYNTGELSPSTSMDMFLRIGLQHSMSSGTNGHAHVLAVVATRSS